MPKPFLPLNFSFLCGVLYLWLEQSIAQYTINHSMVDFIYQNILLNNQEQVIIQLQSSILMNGKTLTAILFKVPLDIRVTYSYTASYDLSGFENLTYLSGTCMNESHSKVYGYFDEWGLFQGTLHLHGRWFSVEEPELELRTNTNGTNNVVFEYIRNTATRCKENAESRIICSQITSPSFLVSKRRNSRQTVHLNADDSKGYPSSSPQPNTSRFCRNDYISRTQPFDPDSHLVKYRRSYNPNTTNTCLLHLLVDHTVVGHVKKPGKDNDPASMSSLLLNLQLILREVNDIYRGLNVSIDGSGKPISGPILFKIKQVELMTDEDCSKSRNTRTQLCNENLDINNLLQAFSESNYDEYCLSYLITARDFQGVLGLAYTSALQRQGGVCSRNRMGRSLNTGLVSIINGQRRIPRLTLVTTLAHEIAHNLGAEHDPDEAYCAPGGVKGNFLMHSHAADGFRENNQRFSPCSIRDISKTLQRITNGQIFNCLEPSNVSICGNGVVEGEEQCDCGYSDSCRLLKDQCCYPADHQVSQLRCKLTPNSKCSPSAGSCCSDTCMFRSKGSECFDDAQDTCVKTRTCPGDDAACPKVSGKSDFLPNGEICDGGSGTCRNGLCSESICVRFNATACERDERQLVKMKKIDVMKLKCIVHCRFGSENTCETLDALASEHKLDLTGAQTIKLPGAVCDGNKGYCDIFQICQPVDNDSPIARLARSLSTKIVSALKKHWIAAIVSVIILLLIAFALVKYCGKYTPTNNPSMKKHQKLKRPGRHSASSSYGNQSKSLPSRSSTSYSNTRSSTSGNYYLDNSNNENAMSANDLIQVEEEMKTFCTVGIQTSL